ncbi:hypothetical protein KPNJ1_01780 [Klebsiella pneumoniae 30660/NJST258_1]|uniref:Uncharacterized protein n=1 Tax=Klebsiella pneumoniae 30684/NJST258_2 TaxID=1420013 RepID=W8UX65_KLEPN|nr:hypothetical protein KPNJ2_01747 [Klebsiella pneumoniae 30684/NJST258_2]AHM84186.1 hypothetical protein KPNJ1_01780 [Klebsiella pneumoniae 30660/NJST258_1]BAH64372.1 hypothetical protein KP1_3805 [Klebsiella pneumoniae subsp. pneumoniae NTUH-K2044]
MMQAKPERDAHRRGSRVFLFFTTQSPVVCGQRQ